MAASSQHMRALRIEDVPLVERLLITSEYVYQRFTLEELPLLLKRYPAVGLFHRESLQGFLLSQITHPPASWISGFGVSWGESGNYTTILNKLLPTLEAQLLRRGVHQLHYSGNDLERDWLHTQLLKWGFQPYSYLYAYDKFDYKMPSSGNQQVTLRPVDITEDMVALLNLEQLCFEDLWRYDATAFTDIAATHPYFVVAEWRNQVIGYQFNALESDSGYLVRIAVHPAYHGQGIGARFMAEAIHFFEREKVTRIMLNTQEDNSHAHSLYEWFGFIRLQQRGFVLRRALF
jgi:[ribosomal protein S18]-alanine N-acetyltransferase